MAHRQRRSLESLCFAYELRWLSLKGHVSFIFFFWIHEFSSVWVVLNCPALCIGVTEQSLSLSDICLLSTWGMWTRCQVSSLFLRQRSFHLSCCFSQSSFTPVFSFHILSLGARGDLRSLYPPSALPSSLSNC